MPWETAAVVDIRPETATAKTFRLRLDRPATFWPGQHYIVRLTAPDGYAASRSYSVASAPDGSAELELTVERLPDGEVSTFLHDELMVGDELEIRGPIGGWFVWRGETPALLVGGGSGIVPLMAMLRYARQEGRAGLLRMVISARTPDDLYYPSEVRGPGTTVVYTRTAPPGSERPARRIAPADLMLEGLEDDAVVYICGSPGFADAASDLIIAGGVEAPRIRIERFGPTG
jgi:ferredoxin-NADP reductase